MPFYFLVFLVLVLVSPNATNARGSRGGPSSRLIDKDRCKAHYSSMVRQHGGQNECTCNNHQSVDAVTKCFDRHICKKKCKSQIKNMHGCANQKQAITQNCSNQCTRDSSYRLQLEPAKIRCTNENQAYINNQLRDACKAHTQTVNNQRPGLELICPGSSCAEYCQQATNKKCSRYITGREEYKNCLDKLNRELTAQLPNGRHLPKGFSWQKCDFGQICAQEIERIFSKVLGECESLKTKATVCCEDPLKCVDKASAALFINAGISTAGGMADICQTAKERFKDMSKAGGKMAKQCRRSAKACTQACKTAKKIRTKFYEICNFDLLKENNYNHKTHTCSEELISQYIGRYHQELIPASSKCEAVGGKSIVLVQVGAKILKTALSSAGCEKEARAGSSPSKPNLNENQVQAVTASGNLNQVNQVNQVQSAVPSSIPTNNPLRQWFWWF